MLNVQKYMTKPIEVEAVQFQISNAEEVAAWCKGWLTFTMHYTELTLIIPSDRGNNMHALVGSYIVRDPESHGFYVKKAKNFESLYETARSFKAFEMVAE